MRVPGEKAAPPPPASSRSRQQRRYERHVVRFPWQHRADAAGRPESVGNRYSDSNFVPVLGFGIRSSTYLRRFWSCLDFFLIARM